jgi:hypothetical protein
LPSALSYSRYLTAVPPAGRRFYRTGDRRWVFLQRLFAHHFQRQLAVLGLGADATDEAIAAAIAGRNGQELEDAIIAGGACGALVRTPRRAGPHAQECALAELPLFTITRTGDGHSGFASGMAAATTSS